MDSKPCFRLDSIAECKDEDKKYGTNSTYASDASSSVSNDEAIGELSGIEEDQTNNDEVDQGTSTNERFPPQFQSPPGLPMPPTIVQVSTPIVLPLFPHPLPSESAFHSEGGQKPQGCPKGFCTRDMIKVCEKRNGTLLHMELEMSSDDPWFVSPSSLSPGMPPMSEIDDGINCCAPCMDRKVGQEYLGMQNDDTIASHTLPFAFPFTGSESFPSIGSALHGTGMCKPCYWFWKPKGCTNKEACLHCHLCPKVNVNQRKLVCKLNRAGLLPQCSIYRGPVHCQIRPEPTCE